MTRDTWCVLPWMHVCVRPNELLKPCCRFQFEEGESDIGISMDTIHTQGADALNNDFMRQLRSDMLNGVERNECRKCYIEEDNTRGHVPRSLRKYQNRSFSKIKKEECTDEYAYTQYIEMSLDNICNLQCRMCDSKFSSKLQLRDKYFNLPIHKKLEPSFEKLNVDLSKLQKVKLLGGEPFMSPNLEKFLDYIIERTDPRNLWLEVVTNGTTIPSDSVIEKLNRFWKLELNVSLDSYSTANDYQRYGSSYIETWNNSQQYEKLFKNIDMAFHSVTSLYTANHLADTVDFLKTQKQYHVSFDFVRHPEWMSLLYAPPQFVDWVIECNAHNPTADSLIRNFVNSNEYNEQYWKQFYQMTARYDSYYKTSLEDYNPELYKVLKALE